MYFKSKKVAELEDVSYEIMSNDESLIGTEGYLTHSEGAVTCKITATAIIPVGGTTPNMLNSLLNKEDVGIGVPIDGGLQKFTGRLTGVSYDSNSKSGKTTGKFTVEGGRPDVT